MQFFSEIVVSTPIWVWALLVFVVYLGVKRSRPRTVRPEMIVGFSLIFVLITLGRLAQSGFALAPVFGVVTGALFGAVVVLVLRPARGTRRLADGRLHLDGEWASLLLLLAIFVSNYVHGVMGDIAPAVEATVAAQFSFALINGITSGFMIARTMAHLMADRDLRPTGVGIAPDAR